MDDGTTLSARCEHPLGSFENPLSRAQIEQKFRTYAAGVLSGADADAVVAAVDRLEDFGAIGKLMDLLRSGAPRAMAAAE
jgi:2-methylcitrate dehydratase PrpD